MRRLKLRHALGCGLFLLLSSSAASSAASEAVVEVVEDPETGNWDLRSSGSDNSRGGRFISVPIFYGDWVPITNAKNTLQAVASHIEANAARYRPHFDRSDVLQRPPAPAQHHHLRPHQQTPGALDRVDVQEAPSEQPEAPPPPPPVPSYGGGASRRPHGRLPFRRRPGAGKRPPLRRQDHLRAAGSRRKHRKLPPPSAQQQQHVTKAVPQVSVPKPAPSFVEQITSFFTGGADQEQQPEGKRRRQYGPQPRPAHHHHQQQQQHQHQPAQPAAPAASRPVVITQDSSPSESLTRGQVFDIPNPHHQQQFVGVRPPPVPIVRKPQHQSHHFDGRIPTTESAAPGPIIKQIPAPDLTRDGPPVYELGGQQQQQDASLFSVPRPEHYQHNQPHLSGFVPIDFEPHTSGENDNRDFAVVLGADGGATDPVALAHLFKTGTLDEKHAYIAPTHEHVPQGFSSIRLPFMEHADTGEELPAVFIAPVGFEVPKGYRGHPLPYDPKSVTSSVTVVHSTDEDDDDAREPAAPTAATGTEDEEDVGFKPTLPAPARNRFRDKLRANSKSRPSLTDFYKSRGKVIQAEEGGLKEVKRKKKRIITKIVRRPLRKFHKKVEEAILPFTTTTAAPAPEPPALKQQQAEATTKKASKFTAFTERPELTNPPLVVSVQEVPIASDQSDPPLPTALPTTDAPDEEQEETTFVVPLLVPEEADDDVDYFQPTTHQTTVYQEIVRDEEGTPVKPTPFVGPVLPQQDASPTAAATTEEEPTAPSTTAASSGYEPTPFKLRPPKTNRLDRFKKLWGTAQQQQETTTPRYRKKYSGKKDGGIYGSRIRSRKRPTFWANGYGEEDEEAVTTTQPPTLFEEEGEESKKTDEYKRKFRPFFDKLYDKLTKKATQRRDPIKSTTTPNPFTINAEIYEVNHNGQRVTATSTETPSPLLPEHDVATYAPPQPAAVPTANYYDDEYTTDGVVVVDYASPVDAVDVDPSAQTPIDADAAQPRLDDFPEDDVQLVDYDHTEYHTDAPTPPLEYNEYQITEGQEGVPRPTSSHPLPVALDPNTPYSYPEAPINYDYVHNDIVDPATVVAADGGNSLDYAESQRVHGGWSDVQVLPPDDTVVADEPHNSRLDTYAKEEIRPSLDLVQHHDQEYQQPQEVFNEHSQQRIPEGYVPADVAEPIADTSYKTKYTDIQRPAPAQEQPQTVVAPIDDVVSVDIGSVLEAAAAGEEAVAQKEVPPPIRIEVEEVPLKPDEKLLDVLDDLRIPVEASFPAQVEAAEVTSDTAEEEEEATTAKVEVTTGTSDLTTEVTKVTTEVEKLEEDLSVDVVAPTEGPAVEADDEVAEDVLEAVEKVEEIFKEELEEVEKEEEEEQEDTTIPVFITVPTEQPQNSEADEPTTPAVTSETQEKETTEKEVEEEEEEEEEVTTTQPPSLFDSILGFFLPSTTTAEPATTITTEESKKEEEIAATTEAVPEAPVTTSQQLKIEDEKNEVVEVAKEPKALDTDKVKVPNSLPVEEEEEAKEISDLAKLARKREELIKNWVSKKYKDEAKRKYHSVLAPTTLAPKAEVEEEEEEEEGTTERQFLFPFAPTIPPKDKKYESDDGDDDASPSSSTDSISGKAKAKLSKLNSRKKHLLDKYAARKKAAAAEKKLVKVTKKSRIPIGSDPNLFRKWGSDSLSQAEFERKVLGVSTATEVSVKSMICVRGRCFDADDMEQLIN